MSEANFSTAVLSTICFVMCLLTLTFCVGFSHEDLIERYGHWVTPLLGASSLMWFMDAFWLLSTLVGMQ